MAEIKGFVPRSRQKRSVLFFLAAVFFLSSAGGVSAGEPVVHLPETVFEFEPVVEGIPVEHDFVLNNRGAAPLAILAVKSG